MAKVIQYTRPDQTLGRYLLEVDILQLKAGARVRMGNAFPAGSVSILYMQNASLSLTELSSLLTGV